MSDLKAALTKLAEAIVKEANASGDDAPVFAEKIEALEQLTKLYIAFQRHPSGTDDDPDGFDFSKGIQTPASKEPHDAAAIHRRRARAGTA